MLAQDWQLEATLEDVFRIQGGDPAVIRERRPALYALTEQAVAEALTLFQPGLVQRRLGVARVEPEGVWLEGGFALSSKTLARRLAKAEAVCAVICSVGEGVSARASQVMAQNQYAYGYALDCAATAALESLARRFCAELEASAALEGLKLSRRFSPGLRSWPVTHGQPEIFNILGGLNRIVDLAPSMQMLPLKSISFVIGLGKDLKRTGSECSDCSMRERCTQRGRH